MGWIEAKSSWLGDLYGTQESDAPAFNQPKRRLASLLPVTCYFGLPSELRLEEREDLRPAVHRLLWAVEGRLVVEDVVAGAVVAVELVVQPRLLHDLLELVHHLRRRVLVVITVQ